MMCCRTLKHPNIVELMAYAKSEEEIVLVTNFVDGSNLDTILFGKKRLEREVYIIYYYAIMTVQGRRSRSGRSGQGRTKFPARGVWHILVLCTTCMHAGTRVNQPAQARFVSGLPATCVNENGESRHSW